MTSEEYTTSAVLVKGKTEFPVSVRYSTRYSLLVRFENESFSDNDTQFDNLIVIISGESIPLGPCQLIHQKVVDENIGYLISSEDIVDFGDLIFKHRKSILQSGFVNLPFILEQKEKIKQEFKDYTADLTYCLSVYRHLFDGMDEDYRDEPEDVKKSIQQAIIAKEGADFIRYFETRLQELEQLVEGYTQVEHEQHGFYFRRQVWSFILASALLRRTNLKPRGYSGDSEMMRMIYKNEELGDSTFSKLMHKHPIEHPAAEAVRNRRKLIAESLAQQRKSDHIPAGEQLKVLSVACGPAFELNNILKSKADCERYEFTLFDQDPLALDEAVQLVAQIEKKLDARIKVEYVQASVRTMMTTRRLIKKLGNFDFIYSMGLFDYLTPPVAAAVFRNLYQLLQPGGELIIGNFHVSSTSRVYMEYWNDWVLYYRLEEDLLELVKGLSPAQQSVVFEDTRSQMFLSVRKPIT